MSVFKSDKDTSKLYVQMFLDQNNPKSKYKCKNELIYIRDFEAVQKTRSRLLSGLKPRGANRLVFQTVSKSVIPAQSCFFGYKTNCFWRSRSCICQDCLKLR